MSTSLDAVALPAVLREAVAAYHDHDADRLGLLYTSNCLFQSPLVVLHGAKEITELWRAWFAAFPDVASQFRQITVDGDLTIIHWTETGTHTGELRLGLIRQPATRRRLVWSGRSTYRVRDSRIAAVHYDMDIHALLAAVQPGSSRAVVGGDGSNTDASGAINMRGLRNRSADWQDHLSLYQGES